MAKDVLRESLKEHADFNKILHSIDEETLQDFVYSQLSLMSISNLRELYYDKAGRFTHVLPTDVQRHILSFIYCRRYSAVCHSFNHMSAHNRLSRCFQYHSRRAFDDISSEFTLWLLQCQDDIQDGNHMMAESHDFFKGNIIQSLSKLSKGKLSRGRHAFFLTEGQHRFEGSFPCVLGMAETQLVFKGMDQLHSHITMDHISFRPLKCLDLVDLYLDVCGSGQHPLRILDLIGRGDKIMTVSLRGCHVKCHKWPSPSLHSIGHRVSIDIRGSIALEIVNCAFTSTATLGDERVVAMRLSSRVRALTIINTKFEFFMSVVEFDADFPSSDQCTIALEDNVFDRVLWPIRVDRCLIQNQPENVWIARNVWNGTKRNDILYNKSQMPHSNTCCRGVYEQYLCMHQERKNRQRKLKKNKEE